MLASITAPAGIEAFDVSADDRIGGPADNQLAEIGRKALAEGAEVSVTAPDYWHEMIAEGLNAGVDRELPITFRETFVETVIIRLRTEDAPEPVVAEPQNGPIGPAPEAPDLDRGPSREDAQGALRDEAAQRLGRAPGSEEPAALPSMRPTLTVTDPSAILGTVGDDNGPSKASSDPAPAETAAPVSVVQQPATEPETVQAPSDSPEPVEPMVDEEESESSRARLTRLLNNGREIERVLTMGQLKSRDELFPSGDVIAVVRPTKAGQRVYWLDGEVDLDRSEINRIGSGRYMVMRRLASTDDDEADDNESEVEAPAEEVADTSSEPVAGDEEANEPIDDAMAAERVQMEARFNNGREIKTTISPAALRADDRVYLGRNLMVVVRRDTISLHRYWLEGEVDFEREEFERLGSKRYRVRRALR